ncbi:MAG TPA: hypothetical protein VII66_03265 [Gemmatimonadaceae bacterium]
MTDLVYRPGAHVGDLQPGECTIHRAADSTGKRWWLLWFYVYREDVTGVLEDFAVPVQPLGPYTEAGAGGRTWGLAKVDDSTWQISPSINAVNEDGTRIHPGPHPLESRWHQTPRIVGVPKDEPWTTGGQP